MMGTCFTHKLRCDACRFTDRLSMFRAIADPGVPIKYRCPRPGCPGWGMRVERQGPTPLATKLGKEKP